MHRTLERGGQSYLQKETFPTIQCIILDGHLRSVEDLQGVSMQEELCKQREDRLKHKKPRSDDFIDEIEAAIETANSILPGNMGDLRMCNLPPGITSEHLGLFYINKQRPLFEQNSEVIVNIEGRRWKGMVLEVINMHVTSFYLLA